MIYTRLAGIGIVLDRPAVLGAKIAVSGQGGKTVIRAACAKTGLILSCLWFYTFTFSFVNLDYNLLSWNIKMMIFARSGVTSQIKTLAEICWSWLYLRTFSLFSWQKIMFLLSPTVHYKFLTLTDAPKREWRKTYTCSKEWILNPVN